MTNEKLFLNPHLKLSDLATEVNISAHQLSQILNENVGKNFSEFINEYRINEACLLLFTHENLSIDGIGYEVGFNSKSTFFAAFKKQKGVTPAIFQQKNRRNSTIL
jgi:AraC-like DNA-binding protein